MVYDDGETLGRLYRGTYIAFGASGVEVHVPEKVHNVQVGHPLYEELIGQIRSDRRLLDEMWADGEHRLEEAPDKIWTVVSIVGAPVAWASARPGGAHDGRFLYCGDNYERRGVGRRRALYQVAYRHRHNTVIVPAGVPAHTFLFAQPIPLHEADGWRKTGQTGVSRQEGLDPHEWWELRWLPPGPSDAAGAP